MPRIEERIEIAAPTSTVFRVCHDADKRPKWDERMKRMELITPAPVRQGHPQKHPALGLDVGRPLRQYGVELFHHELPPGVVHRPHAGGVLLDESSLDELVGQELVEGGAAQVHGLLALGHLDDDLAGRPHPGGSHAGAHHLGEDGTPPAGN